MAKNTWKTIETGKSVRGMAVVKFGTTKIKVTPIDSEAMGMTAKTFAYEDCPDGINKLKDGEYFVAISGDKSEVQRIGPAKGLFTVRCVDFVRPEEGADPAPKTYQYKNKTYGNGEYQAFTALLEVQSGTYKKQTIPFFLHYKFADDGNGNVGFKGNMDKSDNLKRLVEFLDLTGATESTLEWPEDGNILPDLLAIILKKKHQFQVLIKEGYVESMLALDETDLLEESDSEDEDVTDVSEEGDEFEDDEEIEEKKAPAKKASRKAPVDSDDEDL